LILGASTVLVLAVLVAIVVVYIGRSAYRAENQPTPRAAAEAYLYAVLQDRNVGSAGKYVCTSSARRETTAVIKSITSYTHRARGNDISYDWTVRTVAHSGTDRAQVTVDVTATVTAGGATSVQPSQTWTLNLRDQGGWKVASLRRPPP